MKTSTERFRVEIERRCSCLDAGGWCRASSSRPGAIAEDEGRHAELAWAFAGWALEVGDDAVRTGVAAAAEVAMQEAEQTAATGAGHDLSDWGALPEVLRLSLAREHLTRVIRPALDHLMKRHAGGRTR